MAATPQSGVKPRQREYSDADKAAALAALAANGGNVAATAKQLDIPRKTLSEWAKGRNIFAGSELATCHQKKDLADCLEDVARKLVDAMPDKIKDATLQQVATSAAIALDKMQLLRGKPTAISGQDMTDDERAKRIAEILDRARARRDRGANGRLDTAPVVPPTGAAKLGL